MWVGTECALQASPKGVASREPSSSGQYTKGQPQRVWLLCLGHGQAGLRPEPSGLIRAVGSKYLPKVFTFSKLYVLRTE